MQHGRHAIDACPCRLHHTLHPLCSAPQRFPSVLRHTLSHCVASHAPCRSLQCKVHAYTSKITSVEYCAVYRTSFSYIEEQSIVTCQTRFTGPCSPLSSSPGPQPRPMPRTCTARVQAPMQACLAPKVTVVAREIFSPLPCCLLIRYGSFDTPC